MAKSIHEQIKEAEQQLANARARVPKHDIPAALMAEIDEFEEALSDLRALTKTPQSLEAQIKEVQQQLENARARIPKHSAPPALMVEIDELEEELMHLQALCGAS